MGSERDTSRTAVKTYVPRYQKSAWEEHADRLDMSQSEFVRTMVQAGRRGFDLESPEPTSDDDDPGGDAFETRLLRILRDRGYPDWDELVEALSADVETRLDEALDDLQTRNRVRYSGRHGGYALVDDGE